jgi:hypothetical protein
LKAKQVLSRTLRPSFLQRLQLMEKELLSDHWEQLVTLPAAIFDILTALWYHDNLQLKQRAIELYIKRAYKAYDIKSIKFIPSDSVSNSFNIHSFI